MVGGGSSADGLRRTGAPTTLRAVRFSPRSPTLAHRGRLRRRFTSLAAVLLGLAPAAAAAAQDSTATSRPLAVRVLDVGQGDAILIQNGGSVVLVDGGPNPRVLGRYLDEYGLNGDTIDAVILTHAHADHYMGLRELFAKGRHITVRYFWENQDPSPNITLRRLRDQIGARRIDRLAMHRDRIGQAEGIRPRLAVAVMHDAVFEADALDAAGQIDGPADRVDVVAADFGDDR